MGSIAPYAGKLISDEVGSNWRVWLDELVNVLKELIALPTQVGRVLSQMERGDLTVQVPAVSRQMSSLEKAVNRLTGSVIFAALLFGGIMLYGDGNDLIAYILSRMFGIGPGLDDLFQSVRYKALPPLRERNRPVCKRGGFFIDRQAFFFGSSIRSSEASIMLRQARSISLRALR